jgi:hypothetical protein
MTSIKKNIWILLSGYLLVLWISERTKGITMIYKTLHRKLKTLQETRGELRCFGSAVPAPLVPPTMLLLQTLWWIMNEEKTGYFISVELFLMRKTSYEESNCFNYCHTRGSFPLKFVWNKKVLQHGTILFPRNQRHVIVTNSLMNYEWGKDRIVITTNGAYLWSFVTGVFRNAGWLSSVL